MPFSNWNLSNLNPAARDAIITLLLRQNDVAGEGGGGGGGGGGVPSRLIFNPNLAKT